MCHYTDCLIEIHYFLQEKKIRVPVHGPPDQSPEAYSVAGSRPVAQTQIATIVHRRSNEARIFLAPGPRGR